MASVFTFLLLLSLSHLHFTLPTGNNHITDRKSLEIIIGGGGNPPPSPSPEPETEPEDCPPPPPPPCSPPSPPPPPPPPPPCPPPPRRQSPPPLLFESSLIAKAYPILQRFKRLVESDPHKILDSWNGNDVCNYGRLKCAPFPGQKGKRAVESILFNGANFCGKNLRLDGFLDKLETVSIFHANSNGFIGTVPKVSHLKYLFELDLSNNKLSGQFPTTVLGATNLTFLDLRFNTFSGSVDPRVFNLDLDALFINNNNFVQTLSPNLGSITALYLTFANNRFTGRIPDSVGNISYLQEVLFLNNQLTGCLPYQIGSLNQLTVLDVGGNQLTGPVPYSFGCLDKLEQFNLASNKFYGTIPEIVCEISCLMNMSLSWNYFTQVGPKCRELIKKNILDVRMNCILDLPNQKTPRECAEFFMKRQTCPKPKSLFMVPCGKDPNRIKPGQIRPEGEEAQVSSPLSYGALNPNRIRDR